ncbi:MAG: phospholipase phosphocholine-specific [Acidimicrobiales bacterium]|nr:phospholipase phosphocholine-specific [Acidimicrobiales bacterium]
MLTRRDFLLGGSAVIAAGALGACSGGDGRTATGAGTSGPAPSTRSSPPRARLTDVDHVVILMQENRSFDHYFGARPGVRGFSDQHVVGLDGLPPWAQPFFGHRDGYLFPWHLDTTGARGQCIDDPDHSWEAQHAAAGRHGTDGFAATMGARALGYYRRADLPYYWKLADEFTLCDHSFCSVLGPTNPNRYMSMSASIDAGNRFGGPVVTNDTSRALEWPTYPERLQAAGISWRIYHEADDFDDNCVKFFKRFKGLPTTDPLYDAALRNRPADAFELDAAAGNLPQVSWIVAPQAKSEHPLYPPSVGEDYAAGKIAAVLGNAKLWAKTVFIVSYDENGGFFDHVSPPAPPPGTADETVRGQRVGLGYRVPTLVLSPWSRSTDGTGRVVSDVFDHTSTLRFLERRFGVEVPNLSAWRRATCGDLTSTLDLGRTDTSIPSLPATAARAVAVTKGCATLPNAEPPTTQVPPTVEPA